jgi:3'-phosphoadenosine 5'-phosphosulfate sulfotransferase (PAPS reductase)/FAD synthetase
MEDVLMGSNQDIDFSAIEKAERPIFFCSFGKDSSVVLDMIRPYLHKTMVVFVDCGGVYPDVVEWADAQGAKMPNYLRIHAAGDIWEYIKEHGWSVDIEPEDLGELSDLLMQDDIVYTSKVQLWSKCTRDRFWIPSYAFAQMYHPDLYISGERREDRPFADDWELRTHAAPAAFRPLLEWTDQQVWDYIDWHDIKLPKTFQSRQADRRDCYVCFGHRLSPDRVEYLRTAYPDLYDKIFNQLGFSNVVRAMVKHLSKSCKTWTEIEKNM